MAQVDAFNRSFEEVDNLLALIRPADNQALEALIGFLDARMANQGWSLADLAQQMGVSPDWLALLLKGQIPAEQISDAMLERIARAIDYEPTLLHILLGRPVAPTLEDGDSADSFDDDIDATLDSYWHEIEAVLDNITDYMLNRVEERYTSATQPTDERNHRQHDFVIKQIETIIAKHREDIQTVEILVEELKHTVAGMSEPGPSVHRLDIRRIIHYIRDNG